MYDEIIIQIFIQVISGIIEFLIIKYFLSD